MLLGYNPADALRLFIPLQLPLPVAHGASSLVGPETLDLRYPCVPQALILSPSGAHYPEITRALSGAGFRLREVSAAGYLAAARNKDVLLIVPEAEGRQLDPAFAPDHCS